ncbi:hypothetical protein LTR56_025373 [Elasticomyces elasticus]|nr:hypothetical protein LTR56_025373 [Elasticomyces elasticus]KAK4917570.1 hypothetical protein LTR49_014524 [Elasticomyces elasticus]KAK5762790.1 hypothetical protein LTS12_006979 [Elasticomyces elasticus]
MGKRPRTSQEGEEPTDKLTGKKRKSGRAKNVSNIIDGTANSTLYKLPAELRIVIYEFALINNEAIVVDTQLQIPDLLSVSRQVREETIAIWYGNTFLHHITDCNADLMAAWCRHCRALQFCKVDDEIHIQGEPNWDNLVKWCQAQVLCDPSGAGMGFAIDEDLSELEKVISTVTDVASCFQGKGQPWAECKPILDAMRPLLGFQDDKWLE